MNTKDTTKKDFYLLKGQSKEIAVKHGVKPKTVVNIAYRMRKGHKNFPGKGRKIQKTILSTIKKNRVASVNDEFQ